MSAYVRAQINATFIRLKLIAGLGGYNYTDRELRAEAAREVAREMRERRAQHPYAPPPNGTPTLQNVKAMFKARIDAIAARMRDPRTRPPVTLEATAQPSPSLKPPNASPQPSPPSPSPVAPAPDRHQTLGVFTGHPSSAELIPDAEYHSSVNWGSRATDNWRKSIQQNEELQQRRSRWIG
jgi:hypothetical protein